MNPWPGGGPIPTDTGRMHGPPSPPRELSVADKVRAIAQDEDQKVLAEVQRYVDARIAEVVGLLDQQVTYLQGVIAGHAMAHPREDGPFDGEPRLPKSKTPKSK